MADIITESLQSQFLGIPSVVWIVGLLALCLFIWKRKPKQEKYKMLSAEKETEKKYKELIGMVGKGVNKKILSGIIPFGQVGKMADKGDSKLFEFYGGRLALLKRRLHFRRKFMLVPNEAITTHQKEIEIEPSYKYDNELGVLVFGRAGKEKVVDENYKITHEQSINSMVNWLPIQSYLSVQHAQGSEALDHLAEIEKAKTQAQLNVMTGKSKK